MFWYDHIQWLNMKIYFRILLWDKRKIYIFDTLLLFNKWQTFASCRRTFYSFLLAWRHSFWFANCYSMYVPIACECRRLLSLLVPFQDCFSLLPVFTFGAYLIEAILCSFCCVIYSIDFGSSICVGGHHCFSPCVSQT